MGVKKLNIILGESFIVTRPFRYEGNIFHKGDLLRVVVIYVRGSKVLVSNKAWISTKAGHTEIKNQYSFGKGTHWNIPINFIEEQCIPVSLEWE